MGFSESGGNLTVFFQLQNNSPFAESFTLLPLSRSELFKSLKEISMLGIWQQPDIW